MQCVCNELVKESGLQLLLLFFEQGAMRGLGNLLIIRYMQSTTYSALTLPTMVMGISFFAAPAATLSSTFSRVANSDSLLLWRTYRAALLMLPSWTYSLKASLHFGNPL